MKKFFEEYGKVIVIAIVILILLALVPHIGAKIQDNVLGIHVVESDTLFNIGEAEEGTKITIEGTMAKGNIVTIDSKEYRVLSMSDTEAKLLAMYDATKMGYDANNDEFASFNGKIGILYASSDLNNYLEREFYQSLSFKDVIIEQNIVQNMYQYFDKPNTKDDTTYTYQYQSGWDDSDYENANLVGSVNVGYRHVYVLDVKDIFDYFDKRCITCSEFNTMFFNTDSSYSGSSPYKNAWLRSAESGGSKFAWYVYGTLSHLYTGTYSNSYAVRPAFVIDLTKCEYTK